MTASSEQTTHLEMDPDTSDFLNANGFSEYLEKFKDHKIDMAVLKQFDWLTIQSMIGIVGDQIRFRSALQKLVIEKQMTESPFYIHRSASSLSGYSNAGSSCFTPKRFRTNGDDPDNVDMDSCVMSVADVNIKKAIAGFNSVTQHLIDGANDKTIFSADERKLIVHAIVHYSYQKFGDEFRRSKAGVVMEKLASLIVAVFPRERLSNYYIPPTYNHEGRQTSRASGRLLERYYNSNSKFKDHGCSPSQLRRKTRTNSKEPVCEKRLLAVNVPLDDDVCSEEQFGLCKEWLRYNRDPWDDVLLYWRESSIRRIRSVYSLDEPSSSEGGQAPLTVHSITEEWPIIKCINGFSLLEIDFCKMYKIQQSTFFAKWDEVKPKLKLLMAQELKSSKELKPFVLSSNTIKGENTVLLSYIPCLFATKFGKSRNGSRWRPTHLECQGGFISLCKTPLEVAEKKEKRKKRLIDLGETVQPYVIALGPSLDQVSKCFVIVDDFEYEVTNPLQAIDVCFKSIHALGANYDKASGSSWLLLQKFYYGISTAYDDSIKCTEILTIIDRLGTSVIEVTGDNGVEEDI